MNGTLTEKRDRHVKFSAQRRYLRDRLVCSVTRLLCIFLLAFCMFGFAQERHNFLAVDGAIVDDAGPYYFIAYGDSSNAFARAQPLAEALSLSLHFDDENKSLVFTGGDRRAILKATSDIANGLVKRSDVFAVGGQAFERPVPMGILVDGVSYVAVTPLVEAFFGTDIIGWHADARVITIERPVIPAAASPAAPGPQLAAPRIGTHDDFTRIAFDLPAGLEHLITVDSDKIVVTIPGSAFGPFESLVEDGRVRRVYTVSSSAQGGGAATLVIEAASPLASDGSGFKSNITDSGVFYVDIAAGLIDPMVAAGAGSSVRPAQTPAVAENPSSVSEPLAAVPDEPMRKIVVIDAGHGGPDSGATAAWAREDMVVLAIALELRNLLQAEGIEVILTRDNGSFLTLQDRSRFATTERNMFVSIHGNGASNRDAHGIETWVFGQPLDPSLIEQAIRENGGGEEGVALTQEAAQSANIAGELMRQNQLTYSLNLAETVQQKLITATGARDRGVRQNLFYVIRTARIPAILVEVGFISNPTEGAKLATERYQRSIARALADGILEFLESGGTIAAR